MLSVHGWKWSTIRCVLTCDRPITGGPGASSICDWCLACAGITLRQSCFSAFLQKLFRSAALKSYFKVVSIGYLRFKRLTDESSQPMARFN